MSAEQKRNVQYNLHESLQKVCTAECAWSLDERVTKRKPYLQNLSMNFIKKNFF